MCPVPTFPTAAAKEAKPTELNTFFGFPKPGVCSLRKRTLILGLNIFRRPRRFPARTCGKMKMWAQALAGWVTLAGLLAVPAAAFRCALHHRLARFRR